MENIKDIIAQHIKPIAFKLDEDDCDDVDKFYIGNVPYGTYIIEYKDGVYKLKYSANNTRALYRIEGNPQSYDDAVAICQEEYISSILGAYFNFNS